MASREEDSGNLIRFGEEFELDLGACELRREGRPVKLGRIPMELLLLLVEQRGQLVTRDQIVERVWGKGVFLDTDNGINAAVRRIRQTLTDTPEQPKFVQTVVGRGYRFIARIEEGRLEELSRPRGIAIPLAVGALALMTLVLITSASKIRILLAHNGPSHAIAQVQARPSIAVLGFKNLSQKPEHEWISTALSEMLSAELAVGHQLRLIPGENVACMKVNVALPSTASYAPDTLAKISGQPGSDFVVLGSYLAVGQNRERKIHVSIRLQNARTGETICAISEDGSEADLPRLVAQSGADLRQNLQIAGISRNEPTQSTFGCSGQLEGSSSLPGGTC